jgi:DNA-binding transcriptional LysR family regulator
VHIPWQDIQLFLAIVESGSLSAAARRLLVAQPTVSRRLADLEASVGEPLFLRRVEGVALTAFGESLLAPARRMAEWAAEVDRAADRAESAPSGVVRITAPPGLACDFLAPFAAHVRERLPAVRLEVVASVQYLDLSRRDADLALRMARPTQRDLITLASLEYDVAAFATARYIEGLPRGYSMADVGWVAWAPPFEHVPPNPQLAARIPGFKPAFAADDFLVQYRAAEAGAGAIFLGRVRHRFSPPTTLVEMELDVGPLRGSLHLIAARTALEIPRVRAVAELVASEIARADTSRPGGQAR